MRKGVLRPPPRWGPINKTVNIVLLASLTLGVASVPEAWAFTLTVSTAGTDFGNCQTAACRTITYALGQSSGATSDVINVGAGTYNAAGGETFPLALKDGVALIGDLVWSLPGDPPNATISAPAGSLAFFNDDTPLASTTRLAGFTLTNDGAPSDTAIMEFAVGAASMAPRIDHNAFVGFWSGSANYDTGIYAYDDSTSNGSFTATIDNNTFTTLYEGIQEYLSGQGGAGDVYSPVIANNTFTTCGFPLNYSMSTSAEGTVGGSVTGNASTGSTGNDVFMYVCADDTGGLLFNPTISGNTFSNPNGDNIWMSVTFSSHFGDVTITPTISNNSLTTTGGSNIDVEGFGVENGTGNVTFAPVVRDNPTMSATDSNFNLTGYYTNVDGNVSVSPTISGNSMSGTSSGAISISLTTLSVNSNVEENIFSPTITSNTLTSPGDDGIYINLSGLSNGQFVSELTIAGNTITDAASDGVQIDVSSFSGGDGIDAAWTISNNTISGAGANGIVVGLSSLAMGDSSTAATGPFSLTIAGNTITNAGGGGGGAFGEVGALSILTVDGIDIDVGGWGDFANVDQEILIQGNTVTGSTGYGITLSVDGQSGLASNDIRITDNVLESNGTGLFVSSEGWNGEVAPASNGDTAMLVACNTATGNDVGFTQGPQADPTADFGGGDRSSPGNNVLINNTSYDFSNSDDDPVTAENNWWGTTNAGTIESQIWDGDDNAGGSGQVDFDPPLGAAPTATVTVDISDTLVNDVAPPGPSVGDTFEYTATVGSGSSDCGDASVVFTAPIPPNTTYVDGSLASDKGTESVSGDPVDTVKVVIGALGTGDPAVITWRVIADSGTEMSTQGTVTATKSGDTPSNDPDTSPAGDPTLTVFGFQGLENVPTLGEWGLMVLSALLLLLGVALLRRRRVVAASLVLLLATGAGWAGAASSRKGDRSGKEQKTTTAATVKSTSISGTTVTLTLSDGTSLTMPKHDLKVRKHRASTERVTLHGLRPEDRLIELSKVRAERVANRASLKAERQAMTPEQHATVRRQHRLERQQAKAAHGAMKAEPLALLAKGTPVMINIERDAHGRIMRARVETFTSEQEARMALQGRLARKEKAAVR